MNNGFKPVSITEAKNIKLTVKPTRNNPKRKSHGWFEPLTTISSYFSPTKKEAPKKHFTKKRLTKKPKNSVNIDAVLSTKQLSDFLHVMLDSVVMKFDNEEKININQSDLMAFILQILAAAKEDKLFQGNEILDRIFIEGLAKQKEFTELWQQCIDCFIDNPKKYARQITKLIELCQDYPPVHVEVKQLKKIKGDFQISDLLQLQPSFYFSNLMYNQTNITPDSSKKNINTTLLGLQSCVDFMKKKKHDSPNDKKQQAIIEIYTMIVQTYQNRVNKAGFLMSQKDKALKFAKELNEKKLTDYDWLRKIDYHLGNRGDDTVTAQQMSSMEKLIHFYEKEIKKTLVNKKNVIKFNRSLHRNTSFFGRSNSTSNQKLILIFAELHIYLATIVKRIELMKSNISKETLQSNISTSNTPRLQTNYELTTDSKLNINNKTILQTRIRWLDSDDNNKMHVKMAHDQVKISIEKYLEKIDEFKTCYCNSQHINVEKYEAKAPNFTALSYQDKQKFIKNHPYTKHPLLKLLSDSKAVFNTFTKQLDTCIHKSFERELS